jgi:hypothetical protein
MKILITESQYRILTEQYSEDELRTKYVDSGLVPENQFNEIINDIKKPFYVGWLLKMVSSGFIKYEDAYKFKYYFNIFEKFKRHYLIKDLGQIKTLEDVIEFEKKSKNILIKQQETEQGNISDKKNLISTNDIQKLESVGIKYLGIVDGLQAFQVPPEVKDSKDVWNVYRDILGKCSNRDKGQMVSLCTMAGFIAFQEYLNDYPGSSYYVFYNMGDPLSPYQIHYESNQFMNKNDKPIGDDMTIKLLKFLLNKGSLNEETISMSLKNKIGIKLNNIEKNGIKQIDAFLKNYVDGSYIDFENKKIKNTDFNDVFDVRINYHTNDGWSIFPPIILLFESGIKYHPGFGEYSANKFTDLVNKKYPDFNFNYFNYETERNMNWGNPDVNILRTYVYRKMARNSSNERYESLMNDGETNKILHRINDYLTKNFSNLQIVRDKNNRIFKKDNDKIFILSDTNGDFYNNFTVDFDTCHKYIEDVLPIKLKHNNYVIKAIYRRFMLDNYNIDFDEFTYAKLNTNK